MKSWILRLIRKYKIWIDNRKLKKAINQAKKLHLKTGKMYHVVPEESGKLVVVNNDYMKVYNSVDKSKHISGINIRVIAIYSTKSDGLEKKLTKLKLL